MVRCNGTQAAQGPAPFLFDMLTVLTSPCVAGSERVQQHGWQDGLTSTSRDKPRYELYLARAREPYHDCIRSRVSTNARMQPDTMDTHLYRVLVCMCALCERSREEALRRIWEPCCFLCEKKSFVQYAFLLYTVYVLHTFRSPLVLMRCATQTSWACSLSHDTYVRIASQHMKKLKVELGLLHQVKFLQKFVSLLVLARDDVRDVAPR